MLGGLLSNTTSESVYKVPLLGDIPVLGYLFRYNGTSKSDGLYSPNYFA